MEVSVQIHASSALTSEKGFRCSFNVKSLSHSGVLEALVREHRLSLQQIEPWFLCCPTHTKSEGVPRQAEVALGVPGRLRPRIISTFDTTRVVGRQPYAPAAFTPGEIPGTHFQRLSRPQGTWFCQKEPLFQPTKGLIYGLRFSGSHIDTNEHKLVIRELESLTVMRVECSSLDSSGTESGSVTESCEHGFETFGSIKG